MSSPRNADHQRGAEPPPRSRYYADVSSRAGALLLDALLLTIVIFVFAIAVSLLIGPAVEVNPTADTLDEVATLDRGVAIVDAVLSLILSGAYFAGSWVALGATPGQRLLGLRVGAETDGSRLRVSKALSRWALLGAPFGVSALLTTAFSGAGATAVSVATIAWYALLLASTARSDTKQGLHDRIAGSAVGKLARPLSWARPGIDAR